MTRYVEVIPCPNFIPSLPRSTCPRWSRTSCASGSRADVFGQAQKQTADAPALRFLRGAADGQWPARHPSCAGARVQGHLPALQDHARVLCLAQGRLGHARPAGRARSREEARLLRQEGDRGVRRRALHPEMPAERVRVRRGMGEGDRAARLLGRSADRVCHPHQRLRRVAVVDPEAVLGARADLPGLQGRALLPALRHAAQQPRAGAGL